MARSDARVQLLDAALVAALTQDADVFGGDFKGWCAMNKISRATAYRHRKRILEEGRWAPRSTRPLTRAGHATPPEVEAEVVRLRAELTEQLGHEAGADNVGYYLAQFAELDGWAGKGWRVPCRATVHKILVRHGLVTAEPAKKPKSSYRRFAYAQPRDCYQIDATEVVLAGGAKVVVFEVLDDCTRLLVATLAWPVENSAGAIAAITRAFSDFGVPGLVLSDNGLAFTTRFRGDGRSKFTAAVRDADARLIHSSPYHPQTCGKVERHHRTFKTWLTAQPAPTTQTGLQAACDRYQDWYNNHRRHSAWNSPPRQVWNQAPSHGGPTRLPVQQDAHVKVVRVSASGEVRPTADTVVSLGRHLAATTVTVLINGDHATIYSPAGQPLGHLHLDHTTTRQRLHAA